MKKVGAVKYQIQKNQSHANFKKTLTGIIITLIFSGVDLFLLYSMFIAGNLPTSLAIGGAILGALTLDVPPYILGVVVARFRDAAIEAKHKKTYKVIMWISIPIVLLVFLIYISIRISIFIGGGDFNVGLQILLGESMLRESLSDIHAADAISAITPLVTSVFSFVVGLLLYESQEKIIKQLYSDEQKKLVEITARISELEQELADEAKIAWTKFGVNQPFPSGDLKNIVSHLSDGFLKMKNSLYEEIYKKYVTQIHDEAKSVMRISSNEVAKLTATPDNIMSLPIDQSEEDMLSDLSQIEESVINNIKERIS